jgi:hypothetical protein
MKKKLGAMVLALAEYNSMELPCRCKLKSNLKEMK